jgi:hypothetical protein
MNEKEDNLSQQLIELGFPDYQIHDLIFKLKGTDLWGNEFVLLEHQFKSRLDISEIFQEITRGSVLQKLYSITDSEYSWCFSPTSIFEDIEEFSTRISRHVFDPRCSLVKSYEFLVETQDGKMKVITRLTEYEAKSNSDSDPPLLTIGKGVIGPTGYFSFQQ